MNKSKLKIKDLVLLALMGGIMMALKVAMAALPNIEPVSLLIIVTMLVFGWRGMYSVVIYIMLEGLIYGFGIWWVSYIYIWPILAAATMLMRKFRSYPTYAIMAAVFGLCFGALCSIPYFISGGIAAGVSYWVAGIPYDLLHLAGNALTVGILLKPLHRLLARLADVPPWPEKPQEKEKIE